MDAITKHPILKAAEVFGSQKALAAAMDIHPSMISQIANGHRKTPPTACRIIEALTGGAVTCEELRPDIFGKPSKVA